MINWLKSATSECVIPVFFSFMGAELNSFEIINLIPNPPSNRSQ